MSYDGTKRLNCTVVEYDSGDYTEPDPQEAVLVKFKADVFDEFAPTQVTIENSLGQTDCQIKSSSE